MTPPRPTKLRPTKLRPTKLRPIGRITIVLALEVVFILWMIALGSRPGPRTGDVIHGLNGTDLLDTAGLLAAWVCALLVAYLAAVTLLHLVGLVLAAAAPGLRLGRLLSGLATRLGPRRLAALATVATVVGTTAACAPGATSPGAPGSRERSGSPQATMTLVTTPPATATTMTPSTTTTTTATTTTTTMTPSTAEAPLPTAAAPTTTVVSRGDSLWSIAERTVTGRLGRPARDHETAPYWRVLIEVNRQRLVDPTNPDLIHPGQELILP